MCDHTLKPIPEEVGNKNGHVCTKCEKEFDIIYAGD